VCLKIKKRSKNKDLLYVLYLTLSHLLLLDLIMYCDRILQLCGFGIRCFISSGMEKTGSGINIPDIFSESLDTVFRAKIFKFLDADSDPGSGMFDPGWKNSGPKSGLNIPDPQHWVSCSSLKIIFNTSVLLQNVQDGC
jgi:hypothetical protein